MKTKRGSLVYTKPIDFVNRLSSVDLNVPINNHCCDVAVVIMATRFYFPLGLRLVNNWMFRYVGKHKVNIFLFTDRDPFPYLPDINNRHPLVDLTFCATTHNSWVSATDDKFNLIACLREEDFKCGVYMDADTLITKDFTLNEFADAYLFGWVHTHFGYLANGEKPFERNPKSKAAIPVNIKSDDLTYYCAWLFGGSKEQFLRLSDTCGKNLKEDKLNGVEPIWNDESHVNYYFNMVVPPIPVCSSGCPFQVADKGGFASLRDYLDNHTLNTLLLSIEKVKNQPWSLVDCVVKPGF